MRLFAAVLLIVVCPFAQAQERPKTRSEIQQVLSHPLFNDPYVCSEHAAGELPYPGDDLGQDCMIASFDEKQAHQFLRLYKTDGSTNEDWYGWNEPVYSPCNCEVIKIMLNPVTNRPGEPNKSQAAGIILKQQDGTMFALGHLQGFAVKEGAKVQAGDLIGAVGNNGYARAPHIHIGAWRDKESLQIRWDQRAMKTH